jgi:ComF family protein
MPLLQEMANGLSHLLFPQLCEGCHEPLMKAEDTLCIRCFQEFTHTGYHKIPDNEAAMRFAGRVPYQQVTSLAHFVQDGLLQHLLHRLKYSNRKQIGSFLGRLLARDLQESNWISSIDLIIPIPLHPRKEAIRGYNQSTLIANGLHEILGKPVMTGCLKRVRITESQVLKSREERVANVNNAFSVTDKKVLHHKHVLLIDDVLTTGATLESAALSLLEIPGLMVSIATIGIATS